MAEKQTVGPTGFRRFLRFTVRAAVVVVLLPFLLIPLYAVVAPVSTLMIYERVVNGPIERDWVPLDDIAPSLVASVLMSEDGQFCAHNGVDWVELNKVIEADADRPRGASTIPMQTVKNLFLWQSRSYLRKGLEVPLALYADMVLGKRRVMEIYLNVVQWGPGIFGAEAASQAYFGRPASELTARQSALLAATLPNPLARDPANPTRNLQSLANRIASRARASGDYIGCLAPAPSV